MTFISHTHTLEEINNKNLAGTEEVQASHHKKKKVGTKVVK